MAPYLIGIGTILLLALYTYTIARRYYLKGRLNGRFDGRLDGWKACEKMVLDRAKESPKFDEKVVRTDLVQ